MDLSDDELLQLLKTAHADLKNACDTAFAQWAMRYQHELYRWCRYVLKCSENEAKSIAYEALRRAAYSETYTDQKKEITDFSGWLNTIAANLARDTTRKDIRTQRMERQYAERTSRPTMSPEEKIEADDLLLKHMHKLPFLDREILFYFSIQEYSYPTIMDRLGLSYQAARGRVSRAFKKLKEVRAEDA